MKISKDVEEEIKRCEETRERIVDFVDFCKEELYKEGDISEAVLIQSLANLYLEEEVYEDLTDQP